MTTTETQEKEKKTDYADKDGHFRRKPSQFRNFVSSDPNADFPAEKGRYVLYINYGCPWAHRTNIVHKLKGLQDVVQIVEMGYKFSPEGWVYDGSGGSEPKNPLYGFTKHSQLYFKANPNYEGRYLVPTLWDKKRETIVNNESSEIIRMFYSTFDAFVDHSRRESVRAMLPDGKRAEIEAMNEWVYDTINNGVYKTGFASTQKAYNESVRKLFESLDRIEAHLETNGSKYLLGDHITEADVRLYPTIVRFDVAYHTLFKCNLKMIRHDYPRLHTWLRTLYWDRTEETNGGAFADTTHWEPIKGGYTYALKQEIVPAGPAVEILPLGTD